MTKTWNDALTACKLIDGHLIEPANQQQNDNIADLAGALSNDWYWIGITDSETEGDWKTASTKTTIPFENWAPGQPDNFGSNNYGVMLVNIGTANHGKWVDNPFFSSYRFICQL